MVALLLQANPALSYRDVQTILVVTARKDFGAGTQTNTTKHEIFVTRWFSRNYDF